MKHYTFVDYATQSYSALVALLVLLFHNQTVPVWPWLLSAHVAGLFLLHWLIVAGTERGRPSRSSHQAISTKEISGGASPAQAAAAETAALRHPTAQPRHRHNSVLDFLRCFYPVLLYTAFFCETGQLNRMFFSDYLDPMVIRWDQALFGCQPGVILMQKLPWLWLSELLYAAYFSYYIMIAGVGIALFVRNRQHFFHYVSVISFIFYLCYLAYIVLPVIGPQVMTGDAPGYVLPPDLQHFVCPTPYPDAVKNGLCLHLMAWIYRVFEAPGAAFPSSHIAVAFATLYFSFQYLRPIRYLHLAAVLLLCLATLYCHYHYGVDVLSGAATAALLLPLGNWLYARSLRQTVFVAAVKCPG